MSDLNEKQVAALREAMKPATIKELLSPDVVGHFLGNLTDADRAILAAGLQQVENPGKRRTTVFLSQPVELRMAWLAQRGFGNITEIVTAGIYALFEREYAREIGGGCDGVKAQSTLHP